MSKVYLDLNGNYLGGFISFLIKDKDGFKAKLPFVTCRSYMVDALFQMKNPFYPTSPSYPFKYDYKKGSTYIGLNFATDVRESFINNIKWLHDFEEKAGVKKSKILYVKDSNIIIIEGSKYWKDSCWKLSLYTYILKMTLSKNLAAEYPAVVPYIDQLLNKLKVRKEIFDESVYGKGVIMGRHLYEGFNSICNGSNKPMARFLGLTDKAIGE